MIGNFRYKIAKTMGKFGKKIVGLNGGMGKSFPGWLFLKIGSYEALNNLAQEPEYGSIIITGTNGKTTSTTLTIKLLSEDTAICSNFESNTINAIATGLLKTDSKLGVFEYGIRDFEHGIPGEVQRLVDPVGVTYTTISREHTQVLGVKNPFEKYLAAKAELSKNMTRGVVIANADDPRTAFIGKNKEKDVHVNYFGFDINNVEDIFEEKPIKCPKCGKNLKYSKRFMNHRGIYECECGFKRPEPNVKLTNFKLEPERWYIRVEGKVYNYTVGKNVSFKFDTDVPNFGIHNLYNVICSTTVYATFTPTPEKIEKTAKKVFSSLTMKILPPGRFEVVNLNDGKLVGLGQGDNGDALKVNVLCMKPYIKGPLEFIYTTPDVGEEEVFEDHLEAIRAIKPEHLIVIPGRESVDIAKKYYNQIKDEFDADFYPYPYKDMKKRIDGMCNLVKESKYKYILMTGCGEEQAMWEQIKQKIKKEKE